MGEMTTIGLDLAKNVFQVHGKQGDGYLRRLLVVGATAVMRLTCKDNASRAWTTKLLERKPAKLAVVALGNKTARIAWVVMTRGVTCAAPSAA